ncbi:HepT-like ribonuclease domain-containing protein [Hydrogenothermus marinus]|uniref:Uncharacterized protein YutE (UPF0331/DUF86 family) n=1 Tax=Hydrogenothermus marinus TaxID=133270 RepID=A0A3M0C2P8_9AQUI|nr:HepT-like ribonuclease domain-containing protein [Hydrogenothermus marinus]RMA97222.1 uncharacterized protein YutE (UPF0331/DUF86 family) [Hydrogenothermus marinus]
MLPKTIDIKFLNEKAGKVKTYIKKIKQILDLGKEEFENKPIYPDRVKYYLVVLNDELEEISCHLLSIIYNKSFKDNCLKIISKEEIFNPKLSRALLDLYNFKENLMEKNLNYQPENMYSIVSDIILTLDNMFIPELSKIVKELKEKQPKLKISINIKRVQQNISAILSNIKKLKTFLKYSKEEFINSPLFIDRSKYFLVVAIDGANWICKHLLRKLGEKNTDECFIKLYEKNIIDKETAYFLQDLQNNRINLADPTKEISSEKIYYWVENSNKYFKRFIQDIIKAVKG